MPDNPKTTRQQLVLATLRREIVGGVFPPGSRLPVQTELMKRFGVGCSTASFALSELTREGFVVSRRGAGCVVREHPPHLRNIVVALPERYEAGRHWSNYYVAMTRVAGQLREELGRPIRIMEGLEDRAGETYRELNELARTHQVAGIVFVYPPFLYKGTAMLEEPGIPRVVVAASGVESALINTRVELGRGFMESALAYLTGRNRRKVAVLSMAESVSGPGSGLYGAALAASGVVCPSYWQVPVNIKTPQTAQAVVRLLMQAVDRPDALIVTDDNLVEDAVAGLVAGGTRVPEQIEVVAHCNFPWPPLKAVPIRRLGPDIGKMLRDCIGAIDCVRAGKPAPSLIEAPAVWESQVEGATGA